MERLQKRAATWSGAQLWRGAAGDELHEVGEERLAVVLGVVGLGRRLVDRAQLGGDQAQALALEPGDDLPGEAALDGVGLADDEGAVSHDGAS